MQVQDFIRIFAITVLPEMEKIALFRKEDKMDTRGKLMFGDQPGLYLILIYR